MAASRSVAREEEGRQRRCRETDHHSGQRGASTVPEADLASTIEQLPSHLWLMVSLVALTVTPFVEGRMIENRGKVSHLLLREILLISPGVMSLMIVFFFV